MHSIDTNDFMVFNFYFILDEKPNTILKFTMEFLEKDKKSFFIWDVNRTDILHIDNHIIIDDNLLTAA